MVGARPPFLQLRERETGLRPFQVPLGNHLLGICLLPGRQPWQRTQENLFPLDCLLNPGSFLIFFFESVCLASVAGTGTISFENVNNH